MNPHHEYEFEAAPGLPETLPAGERVLWQGAPQAALLARHVFHLRKLMVYFAGMITLQALYVAGDPTASVASSLSLSVLLVCVCLGFLRVVAWYAARNTMYTLTNRRVVMRIGMVLTLSLNIPLKKIQSASLRSMKSGSGDLALGLNGPDRLGWLHLWPHVRAWTFRQPEPCLRCIPDLTHVAALFAKAWQAENPHAPVAWGKTVLPDASYPMHGAASAQAS